MHPMQHSHATHACLQVLSWRRSAMPGCAQSTFSIQVSAQLYARLCLFLHKFCLASPLFNSAHNDDSQPLYPILNPHSCNLDVYSDIGNSSGLFHTLHTQPTLCPTLAVPLRRGRQDEWQVFRGYEAPSVSGHQLYGQAQGVCVLLSSLWHQSLVSISVKHR